MNHINSIMTTKTKFLKYGYYSLVALYNNGLELDVCKHVLSILLALLNRSLNDSLSLHKIYSGLEFNRICKEVNAKIYKFLNYDNGYKIGLNIADDFIIDIHDENKCFDGRSINAGDKCFGGRLINAGDKCSIYWFDENTKLALIEIPDDARVFVQRNGLKVDMLIVKDKVILRDVDDDNLWIDIIQNNGLILEFVKNQTDEICIIAVQQNGNALQYVKKQTDIICKLAVQQNATALAYVENKTNEIFELAEYQANEALKLGIF